MQSKRILASTGLEYSDTFVSFTLPFFSNIQYIVRRHIYGVKYELDLRAKAVCPRCKKVWIVQQGESEVDCNCHLYCEEGSKPSDCTLSSVSLDHEVGWPYGVHVDGSTHNDDVMHIQNYCSTHSRYSYKVPITIPVDWTRWRGSRAHKRFRLIQR